MKKYYIYILASKKNGTLYIGVTSNLIKRTYEHKKHVEPGFTQKYNVHKSVYHEVYEEIYDAIERENCLKRWKREWKIKLIEKSNPDWDDLYNRII